MQNYMHPRVKNKDKDPNDPLLKFAKMYPHEYTKCPICSTTAKLIGEHKKSVFCQHCYYYGPKDNIIDSVEWDEYEDTICSICNTDHTDYGEFMPHEILRMAVNNDLNNECRDSARIYLDAYLECLHE